MRQKILEYRIRSGDLAGASLGAFFKGAVFGFTLLML